MANIHRLLFRALVTALPLAALAGCEVVSSDYWHSPSVLTTQPPPPPPRTRQENRGGFAVLVGAPGQPETERVLADIEAFARSRGFVRRQLPVTPLPPPTVPQQYDSGDITLDVIYQPTAYQVSATLHSFNSRLNRKYIHQFYQDFRQQYGTRYSSDGGMFEN